MKNIPWHLWLINVLSMLFFCIGAYDFINIAAQNLNYLKSHYSPEGVSYFTDYPLPLLFLFGSNILTGLLGILSSFFYIEIAARLILISGITNFILIFITVVFMDRVKNIGLGMTLQDITIMIATFGLLFYYKWLNNVVTK